MMTKSGWIALIVGIATPLMAAEQPDVVSLRGLVIRESGRPVASVGISALQKPPPITLGPMDDVIVGRAVTDSQGRFTINVPRKTKINRLYLTALGPWKKITDGHGKIVRIQGTSVPLEKVTKEGINKIIVSNDFIPLNPKRIEAVRLNH